MIALKLTSAIAIGGKIAKAGDVIEVSEPEARSLLHREKAVLAVQDATLIDEGDIEAETPVAEVVEQPRGKRSKKAD